MRNFQGIVFLLTKDFYFNISYYIKGFQKQVFLKSLQISQENTCVGATF